MPTYKHPCPQCDAFIDRAVERCPTCGFANPFGPDAAMRAVRRPAPSTPPAVAATATPASVNRACTGCGAALAPGARFCTECGTVVE